MFLPRQVAEGDTGQEDEEVASRFPRKTARLVVASPLDRIRDLRWGRRVDCRIPPDQRASDVGRSRTYYAAPASALYCYYLFCLMVL